MTDLFAAMEDHFLAEYESIHLSGELDHLLPFSVYSRSTSRRDDHGVNGKFEFFVMAITYARYEFV